MKKQACPILAKETVDLGLGLCIQIENTREQKQATVSHSK
jgi:hypothetical protein